jgi:predicted HTH transcriptional regulator
MDAVTFPSDEELCTIRKFPFAESQNFEYKECLNISFKDKILATICAFLNGGGGYLILGVRDNLDICGIDLTPKELDCFLLKLDHIIHHSQIVTCDNENIPFKTIETRVVRLITNRVLILIKVTKLLDSSYKLSDGSVYYRLNCSNYKISSSKVYNQSQMWALIEKERSDVQSQHIEFLNALREKLRVEHEKYTELMKEKEMLEEENKKLRSLLKATKEESIFDNILKNIIML